GAHRRDPPAVAAPAGRAAAPRGGRRPAGPGRGRGRDADGAAAMSLELRDVTVAYGALRAVDGVSLTPEPGEICGLVGPNASGKSTLLTAITGITPLSGGTIALDGHDVTTAPPHELARLGVARTFQLIRLLHGLPVRDNVLAGAYVRRPDDVDGAVARALE